MNSKLHTVRNIRGCINQNLVSLIKFHLKYLWSPRNDSLSSLLDERIFLLCWGFYMNRTATSTIQLRLNDLGVWATFRNWLAGDQRCDQVDEAVHAEWSHHGFVEVIDWFAQNNLTCMFSWNISGYIDKKVTSIDMIGRVQASSMTFVITPISQLNNIYTLNYSS